MNKSGLNTWNDEEVRELQLRLDAINKNIRRAKLKRLLLHPINALIGIYSYVIGLFIKQKKLEYGWATSISNEKNGDGTITVKHYDVQCNLISKEVIPENELDEEIKSLRKLESLKKLAPIPSTNQDEAARGLTLLMQEKGMLAKYPDAFDYQVAVMKNWDYATFSSYEKCIMAMQQPKRITSEPESDMKVKPLEFSAPLTKENITEAMDELEKYAEEVVSKTDKQKE